MIMARTACWRVIDAPAAGEGTGGQETASNDPELEGMLNKLRELDSKAPQAGSSNKDIVDYNLARVDLLEAIYKKVKQEDREQWARQIADCLGAAAQNSVKADTRGYQQLLNMESCWSRLPCL